MADESKSETETAQNTHVDLTVPIIGLICLAIIGLTAKEALENSQEKARKEAEEELAIATKFARITEIYIQNPCDKKTKNSTISTKKKRHSSETVVVCPPVTIDLPGRGTQHLHRKHIITEGPPVFSAQGSLVKKTA